MATPLAPRDGSLAMGIPELRKERSLFSFPVHNLSHIIYGSKENFERKQYLDSLVKGDPAVDSSVLPFLSHADRYKRSLQTVNRILQLKERNNLSQKDYEYLLYSSGEWHSLSLQEVYFGALVNLASDEQLKKYHDDSRSFRIVGCYAQTEIGHGSNVQGLQTTATYLPDEDAFDLHTPSIEATKWWVGALGKSATHAIVFARLILPDGDHGVHGFMLQLRCLKTHKLLPGIVTGDIGPKFGFAGVDNGSLRLNHVKIPRTEMLSRFGSVLPGGKYSRPPHDKLGYAGMTATRVNLAILSGQMLARAATVAVRYSLVRRQGEMNKKEVQIIDYTVQQHRLFTQLANAYALHFSGSHLTNLLENYKKGVSAGQVDLDLLKELHVTSSGLKSACTTIAAEGIEDCRKCCGGHGYSQFGGLADLFTSFVHTCTAEGDNYILTQQTVRYLRDAFKLNRQGKFKAASPFTKYLEKTAAQLDSEKSTATEANCFSDPKVLLAAYEHRAARSVSNVVERMEAATKRGLSDVDAWNSVLVEVYHTSMAHCLLLIYGSFLQALEKSKAQPAIYTVLKRLCDLFALHHIEKGLAEFLEDGYFSRKQVSLLKDRSRQLLTEIRRDALGLVDAWDFTDNTLNSALGRYDGNVYETLYNWAQKEPLNRKEVADGVEEYIRPMIQGKLSHL